MRFAAVYLFCIVAYLAVVIGGVAYVLSRVPVFQ